MIGETFQTQSLLSEGQPSFDALSRCMLTLPDRPGMQVSVYYAPAHSPALGTVLLVPGFLQPAYCWRKQIGPLIGAGWNVLTWDPSWSLHQGGWTESIRSWTAELATVLAASPFPAHLPVALVGWSLGGVLVGELLRHPIRPTIAGLVLVGTPLFLEHLREAFTGTGTGTDAPMPFNLSEPLTVQWLVRFTSLLTTNPPAFGEIERHLGGSCLALARLLESANEPGLSLASLPPPLPADQVRERIPWPWPCLIIHGENDRLVPPMLAARQLVRELEDAGAAVTLSLYPTGHAPFIEEPERFNRELVTFLEECLSSAPVPARSLS